MSNPLPPPPSPKKTGWEPYALPGIDVPLRRFAGPTRPGVPRIDEGYVFREELVRELAWSVWPHDGGAPMNCLLVGPKGSGKTSLVLQIAARCNVPVHRVNLNVGTTVRHLKGRPAAEAGGTTFVPGVATIAAEEGSWLVLDELSGVTPPVALALLPVLEPDGAILLEDEQPPRYVRRHPDFRIFGTDNTIGAEQEEGRFSYAGTNPDMNEALMDRFGTTVQVGYLDAAKEAEAIKAIVPGIDGGDLEGLVRVARAVRSQSDLGVSFSFRMLVDWSRCVSAGTAKADGTVHPPGVDDTRILQTAYPAFLTRMRSKVERDAVAEHIRRIFAITGAP